MVNPSPLILLIALATTNHATAATTCPAEAQYVELEGQPKDKAVSILGRNLMDARPGVPREEGCALKRSGDWIRHGQWTTWKFPPGEGDSTAREIATYTRDRLDGPYTQHAGGVARAKGQFKDGKRTGQWEFFDDSGRLEAKGTLAGRHREGSWTFYDPSGEAFAKGGYVAGKPSGQWAFRPGAVAGIEAVFGVGELGLQGPAEWTSTTAEWSGSATFKNGLPDGDLSAKRELDGLTTLNSAYKNGFRTGALQYAKEDLVVKGTYAGGLREGRFETRDGKRVVERSNWKANQLDGSYQSFWPSGAKRSTASYRKGKAQGGYQSWYPDGTLAIRANYSEGALQGTYTQNWPNGKPAIKATYKGRKLNGPFTTYRSNGSREASGTYAEGVWNGTWSFYDGGDRLVESWVYKDGQKAKFVGGNDTIVAEEIRKIIAAQKKALKEQQERLANEMYNEAVKVYVDDCVKYNRVGMRSSDRKKACRMIATSAYAGSIINDARKIDRYFEYRFLIPTQPTRAQKALVAFLFCEDNRHRIGMGCDAKIEGELMAGLSRNWRNEATNALKLLEKSSFVRFVGISQSEAFACMTDTNACPGGVEGAVASTRESATAEIAEIKAVLREQASLATSLSRAMNNSNMMRTLVKAHADAALIMVNSLSANNVGFLAQAKTFVRRDFVNAASGVDFSAASDAQLLQLAELCVQTSQENAIAAEQVRKQMSGGSDDANIARAKGGVCREVPAVPEKLNVYMNGYDAPYFSGSIACTSAFGAPGFGSDRAVVQCDVENGWIRRDSCKTVSGKVRMMLEGKAQACEVRCGALVPDSCESLGDTKLPTCGQ